MVRLQERVATGRSAVPIPFSARRGCPPATDTEGSNDQTPITPECPCRVLQYMDDTLILVRAETDSVLKLKELLDSFALATGLNINFHKCSGTDECGSISPAAVHLHPGVS